MIEKFKSLFGNDWSKVSMIGTWIFLVAVVFKFSPWQNAEKSGKLINWDVVSYYAYLPATFEFHDLTLQFVDNDSIDYAGESKFWPSEAPNGGKVIKTTMGMSLLYAPFYAAASVHSFFGGVQMNSFSVLFEFYLCLSNLAFILFGLFFLRKVLNYYFSNSITAIVIPVLFVATNLFYYITVEPLHSHAYSFSLIAAFLWQTIQWHHMNTLKRSITLGLLTGLIVLVRPVNILVVFFFVMYEVTNFSTLKQKLKRFVADYKSILVISGSAFLVWVPQLIYWKIITGSFFFNSYIGEQFYFLNPHVIDGLFSYRKGWLLYTPVMIFAIIGLYFLPKKIKLGAIVLTVLLIYVVFSWWNWWYGGSFGARPMIDFYAFFAIAIAAFLNGVSKYVRLTSIAVIGLFTLLNVFQTLQVKSSAIHWDSMTKEAYWHNFMTLNPLPGLDNKFKSPNDVKAKRGEDEY
ncbi:MAG: hypothetical protein ACI9N1_001407 [Flavobacteriales bacterium]|jgi:hypothetical protein